SGRSVGGAGGRSLMLTVAQALQWAQAQLHAAKCAENAGPASSLEPAIDAQWLLAHVLQKNHAWLRAWGEQVVADDRFSELKALIARRCAGEPVAYLTGRQGFWSLELE